MMSVNDMAPYSPQRKVYLLADLPPLVIVMVSPGLALPRLSTCMVNILFLSVKEFSRNSHSQAIANYFLRCLTLAQNWGYASLALAKSNVGISLPRMLKAHKSPKSSFMRLFLCAPTCQWWAAWGHLRVRRFLECGKANPMWLTTQKLAFLSGDLKNLTQGGSYA